MTDSVTPRIDLLLDMIIGDRATKHAWLENRNLVLDAVPNDLLQTKEGEQRVYEYLMSRTSLGR